MYRNMISKSYQTLLKWRKSWFLITSYNYNLLCITFDFYSLTCNGCNSSLLVFSSSFLAKSLNGCKTLLYRKKHRNWTKVAKAKMIGTPIAMKLIHQYALISSSKAPIVSKRNWCLWSTFQTENWKDINNNLDF